MKKITTIVAIFALAFTGLVQNLSAQESNLTAFLTFSIPNQVTSTIDNDASTIEVVMPQGSSLTALIPTFTVSEGATVSSTLLGQVTSTVTEIDFTNDVTLTVINGEATRDWVISVSIESSIADKASFDVNVYPNPASEYIYVDNAYNTTIAVYNIIGNLVTVVNSNQDKYELDLSTYASGTYLVRVQKADQIVTKKISIVK
jgi:hypothetical protein